MNNERLDLINSVIRYDPDTGKFFWKKRTGGSSIAGNEASGTTDCRGYVRIGVLGCIYKAHRLAMFITYGKFPDMEIDHINGNKADNRISNLREASRVKNQQNQISAYKSNSTGLLGVSQHKPGVWRARLCVSGKNKSLGLFSSPELAHEAYKEAKRVFHEGCTI